MQGNFAPTVLSIVALQRSPIVPSLLSYEKIRKKPATRQLDESFAALVKCKHQFAR